MMSQLVAGLGDYGCPLLCPSTGVGTGKRVLRCARCDGDACAFGFVDARHEETRRIVRAPRRRIRRRRDASGRGRARPGALRR